MNSAAVPRMTRGDGRRGILELIGLATGAARIDEVMWTPISET